MDDHIPAMRGEPHHIDIHVGRRLKLRRTLMGMSQEKLGELLGLTFQQVQKYERGANRIGASRLYEIGRVLDVPVSFFFEDLAPEVREAALGGLAEAPAEFAFQHDGDGNGAGTAAANGLTASDRRDTLELVRAFERLRDPDLRRRVLDLAKAMANFDERLNGAE